ncbi:hypothetical protein PF011_g26375 [Phytophthora fragariae]|uniref:RxLR effector protein n=1 Tax=Phytophthora fragariae TaxID=53985 RepID=A0A6A3HJX4_9STRA|nr:hypothetical protein PF011_g26375 [Phytophthora fragariae]
MSILVAVLTIVQAASGSVAAFASTVSVLVHGMLRLPSGKVPVSVRVAEAGDGVRATIAKLPLSNSKRCPPAWSKLVMASALAHGKLKISFCHNAVSLPFFCLTDNTGSGGKEGSRTDNTDAGGKVVLQLCV